MQYNLYYILQEQFGRVDLLWGRYHVPQNIYLVSNKTLLRRPNKAGLKCTYVCTYVGLRPFTSLFDFNEIWHVGRGRILMNEGVQYDPIQGQDKGHEPFKFGNSFIFKSYLLRHLQWELATDH